MRVVVIKSRTLELVSTVIGWTYFVAWSVSFYPQIWDNFRRKRWVHNVLWNLSIAIVFSVIGLNFDFLALNIVGFTLYGCYNIALFWIDSVQVCDNFNLFFLYFNTCRLSTRRSTPRA